MTISLSTFFYENRRVKLTRIYTPKSLIFLTYNGDAKRIVFPPFHFLTRYRSATLSLWPMFLWWFLADFQKYFRNVLFIVLFSLIPSLSPFLWLNTQEFVDVSIVHKEERERDFARLPTIDCLNIFSPSLLYYISVHNFVMEAMASNRMWSFMNF